MLFLMATQRLNKTDNTSKFCLTCYFKEKKKAFLKNTANKHHVINVKLTERMKTGCNEFHSCDAAVGTTKFSVQSSLKFLVTEISETNDLLLLLL